jgi:DHA2 family multidrug resistance protein
VSGISIDYLGIALIVLTFAAFQIMLDRGEDLDWFQSGFIVAFAIVAAIAAAGAVGWLLYTAKPVVDLRVLKDRNFALGSAAIVGFGVILYGSAVIIPQLAQEHLGYTALLAGLVLSPGAVGIIFLIPLITVVMPYVQTRFIVALGFLVLGSAMLYSQDIPPDVSYGHLVLVRATQSLGIGFLFVPVSVLAYLTIPKVLQADGTALFIMFRNVAGSVGISLSTAAVQNRTQVHMAYLSSTLNESNPNLGSTLSAVSGAIRNMGTVAGSSTRAAMSQTYQTLIAQAGFLAYQDVFLYCAVLAFAFVPLAFLFSGAKATQKAGAD